MKYVVYDQFHWNQPNHLVRPVTGTKQEVLEQYAFYKDCFPQESLGLLPEKDFNKLKENIMQ